MCTCSSLFWRMGFLSHSHTIEWGQGNVSAFLCVSCFRPLPIFSSRLRYHFCMEASEAHMHIPCHQVCCGSEDLCEEVEKMSEDSCCSSGQRSYQVSPSPHTQHVLRSWSASRVLRETMNKQCSCSVKLLGVLDTNAFVMFQPVLSLAVITSIQVQLCGYACVSVIVLPSEMCSCCRCV